MDKLIKPDVKMTSLDIVKITGKAHKNVMRDIRNEITELGEDIGRLIFEPRERLDSHNRRQPYYAFGKKGAMQLALKYDAVTRFKVIERIEELENKDKSNLPMTYKDALIKLVETIEEVEQLESANVELITQNEELKPKASYYDLVLQNKSLLSVSQIAKDYGMSATALNKKLHELGIQYKQGGVWMLYARYQDKGYTQSTTHVIDSDKSSVLTKWSQAGRVFIYETLKKEGILPVIESVEDE